LAYEGRGQFSALILNILFRETLAVGANRIGARHCLTYGTQWLMQHGRFGEPGAGRQSMAVADFDRHRRCRRAFARFVPGVKAVKQDVTGGSLL